MLFERVQFLVVYVGSAAMVAFLAACLTSPRVASFNCYAIDSDGTQTCELAATLATIAPEAAGMNLEVVFGPERASRERESSTDVRPATAAR